MPKKNNRPDARRDANEPEIIDYLEDCGYTCHRIGNPGDLLVWNPISYHWVCLEVKVPAGYLTPEEIDYYKAHPHRRAPLREAGRMTPAQSDYRKKHPDIDIPIVRTKEQALIEVKAR